MLEAKCPHECCRPISADSTAVERLASWIERTEKDSIHPGMKQRVDPITIPIAPAELWVGLYRNSCEPDAVALKREAWHKQEIRAAESWRSEQGRRAQAWRKRMAAARKEREAEEQEWQREITERRLAAESAYRELSKRAPRANAAVEVFKKRNDELSEMYWKLAESRAGLSAGSDLRRQLEQRLESIERERLLVGEQMRIFKATQHA